MISMEATIQTLKCLLLESKNSVNLGVSCGRAVRVIVFTEHTAMNVMPSQFYFNRTPPTFLNITFILGPS